MDEGVRKLPALVAPLLGILRRQGPVLPEDPVLDRFAAYLKNVVGVTPATTKSYCEYVRPFVLGIFDSYAIRTCKTGADSAYVVGFILAHAAHPNATRCRIVSAVRTSYASLVSGASSLHPYSTQFHGFVGPATQVFRDTCPPRNSNA